MAPKTLNKIMQVNIADQPYWATIQPMTGPSRNVPIEPTPRTKKTSLFSFSIHIDEYLLNRNLSSSWPRLKYHCCVMLVWLLLEIDLTEYLSIIRSIRQHWIISIKYRLAQEHSSLDDSTISVRAFFFFFFFFNAHEKWSEECCIWLFLFTIYRSLNIWNTKGTREKQQYDRSAFLGQSLVWRRKPRLSRRSIEMNIDYIWNRNIKKKRRRRRRRDGSILSLQCIIMHIEFDLVIEWWSVCIWKKEIGRDLTRFYFSS